MLAIARIGDIAEVLSARRSRIARPTPASPMPDQAMLGGISKKSMTAGWQPANESVQPGPRMSIAASLGGSDKYPRPVGAMFARPSDPFVANEILPNLDAWDTRTGQAFDVVFPGYGAYLPEANLKRVGGENLVSTRGPNGVPWQFSNAVFFEECASIEALSNWTPSGGCDLILMDAISSGCNSERSGVEIAWSPIIVIDVQRAIADGVAPSANHLMEIVFRRATDPAVENIKQLSDSIAARRLPVSLFLVLLRLFPGQLDKAYQNYVHFAVR